MLTPHDTAMIQYMAKEHKLSLKEIARLFEMHVSRVKYANRKHVYKVNDGWQYERRREYRAPASNPSWFKSKENV
jgi:hypothetical protein